MNQDTSFKLSASIRESQIESRNKGFVPYKITMSDMTLDFLKAELNYYMIYKENNIPMDIFGMKIEIDNRLPLYKFTINSKEKEMDTSFKDYSDLYKWASEGKPIMYEEGEVIFPNEKTKKYPLEMNGALEDYAKVFENEKIQMYKHWYKHAPDNDEPLFSRETTLNKEEYENCFSHKVIKTITLEPITLD